jgi:hypothetical protein
VLRVGQPRDLSISNHRFAGFSMSVDGLFLAVQQLKNLVLIGTFKTNISGSAVITARRGVDHYGICLNRDGEALESSHPKSSVMKIMCN